MAELFTLLAAKDLAWFLGPIALGLVAVILFGLYLRFKKNGNGNHAQTIQQGLRLDDRMTLLESNFGEFKTLVQTEVAYLTKDVDELKTTSGRFGRELSVISDRLERIHKHFQ